MGNDILEIRAHVADMVAANQAVLDAVAVEVRSPAAADFPEARWVLERIDRTLRAHIQELREHLRRLGGATTQTPESDALASELVKAAAARLRPRSPARALRNCYTALSLTDAAALMLETTARAHAYSSTAAMATRHREEVGTILTGIRDLLPAAIKDETDRVGIPT